MSGKIRNNKVSSNGSGKKNSFTSINGNEDKIKNMEEAEEPQSSSGTFCGWNFSEKRRLVQILKKKQNERATELAKLQSQYKLEAEQQRIVGLDWESLVNALQSRELTATQALEAYIAKALEATVKCNSITDFIPQAHEWAKELDGLTKVRGPLHGVPVCIKDDTNVEGMDTTHGFIKQLYKPAKESAVIVKMLQALGAVPFCKTNVPQTLFTYGSDNPVFGMTKNATNQALSPGGSSSGTGSLVGSHGCMFGTGTDIGGSLRIPAHFNGVSSIKPTNGRLTDKGIQSSLPNLIGLTPSPGIIGQTPSIVASVFQRLIECKQQNYDPASFPTTWDDEVFKSTKKLRIGYITSVPYFPPLGDTEEVVLRAKTTLESLGHTLVPFPLPDGYHYMNVFAKFVLADHTRYFKKCWKGEDIADAVKLVWLNSKIPYFLQGLLRRLMMTKIIPFLHSKRTGVFFGVGACSSTDLWDAMGEKKIICDQMMEQWQKLEIDAVISPLLPFPAIPLKYPGLLPTAVVYSLIWNIVDYPAGMVPFGFESGKNIDSYDHEGDMALKMAKEAIKGSTNAPIGVQVIGLPYKEEMVFRVMKELEPFGQKSPQTL